MNFKTRGADLGLDEVEFRELIDMFLDSCGSDLQLLQDALAAGDFEQVMHRAHTIKGASSNLGLNEVSAAAKSIEDQTREKQWNDLNPKVKVLRESFNAVVEAVREA